MGKTKTAFVSDEAVEVKKTSAEKYAEKMAKRQQEKELGNNASVSEKHEDVQEEVKAQEKEAPKQNRETTEKRRSKKYAEAKANVNKSSLYKITEAVDVVKKTSYTKFDGTMELHLVLKKGGVNINVTLPHSAGKTKKVEVASDDTIAKLQKGKIDFDVLLSTPEMMPKLVAFAKLLGPRGLMPNPKNGTIIKSAKEAEKFGGNTINLKSEKEAPLIHTSFGKVSQSKEELVKNAEIIIEKLGGNKAVIRAFMKSTMSPSVKLEV